MNLFIPPLRVQIDLLIRVILQGTWKRMFLQAE